MGSGVGVTWDPRYHLFALELASSTIALLLSTEVADLISLSYILYRLSPGHSRPRPGCPLARPISSWPLERLMSTRLRYGQRLQVLLG